MRLVMQFRPACSLFSFFKCCFYRCNSVYHRNDGVCEVKALRCGHVAHCLVVTGISLLRLYPPRAELLILHF